MSHSKLFFIFFIFLVNSIHSQEKNINDSIFFSNVLKKTSNFQHFKNFKKASYYFSQKEWDSTLIYTQKQLSIKKQDIQVKNYCYLFRGIALNKKEVYEEAINQLRLVSNNFKFSDRIKFYLGILNLKLEKYNKALSYFKQLESIPKNKLLYLNYNDIFDNIGLCYLFLKKYEKSEIYLKKSYQNETDTIKLIRKYVNIANLYYTRYQDDIAIPYFEKAYKLSKDLSISHRKIEHIKSDEKRREVFKYRETTSENMSVVEENRKDFKKALVYRKEMLKWSDSLNNQNRIYEVAKKEKEFAVKEKQKEVDFLQVENELKETQRNNVIYIASVLLLLLFVSIYFYREKVKRNKIIAEQKENLDALNNTKDKLFSIVSHDLRSSVNALKTSNTVLLDNLQSKNINALEGLLQKNSAIVNGAYGLLDNLLNWALLQTNQGYFHIESLRLFIIVEHVAYNYKPLLFEKELSFENSISKKALIYADQESLKIILRNLLDNAIKFSKPNGALKVYSEEAGDFWNLIVEDTGLGMSEATRQELLKDSALLHKKEHEEVLGTGLGLSLVKSMIHKNHGKFNIKSELGKGTKMIVSLPKTQPNG
ncbi:sensor histidine kinase [Tenacibaculum sp. M341]|nr:sensor histidine kinase [Tenacibaculum sp. M341]